MKYTSIKTGTVYYLHKMQATNGAPLFYFSKTIREDRLCEAIPDDRIIVESSNGFPIIRKLKA